MRRKPEIVVSQPRPKHRLGLRNPLWLARQLPRRVSIGYFDCLDVAKFQVEEAWLSTEAPEVAA